MRSVKTSAWWLARDTSPTALATSVTVPRMPMSSCVVTVEPFVPRAPLSAGVLMLPDAGTDQWPSALLRGTASQPASEPATER